MTELPPIGGPMIVQLLETIPLMLGDEKLLQAETATRLDSAGINYRREVRLSEHDIIDFMIEGGVAIEMKIKGGRHAIYRQCERYCMFDAVRTLVLATNVAMSLPAMINGKPTHVASLGRGWL